MNRAMLSGVAGMKAHQTKMDVIGNNIANVNTYGYKSQRAVFSDVFYKTIRDASAGTASRGGTNASTVGYGSSLQSVQTQMSQSNMQNTGFGLDVAIMGEGFLQVMDQEGNIFFTKAGLLDYDSNGYLTDINGNFVLGASGPNGTAGTQKIKLDNIGIVDPRRSTVTEPINGVEYTITASNMSSTGNLALSIGSSETLPAGLRAVANVSNTGSISVTLNAFEEFASMSDLNDVVNQAITEANGGKEHAGGVFTITANEDRFGKPVSSASFNGSSEGTFLGGAKLTGVDANFSKTGKATFDVSGVQADGNYTLTATVDGVAYTGAVTPNGGSVTLTGGGNNITMKMPTFAEMKTSLGLTGTPTQTEIETALKGSATKSAYKIQAYSPAQSMKLTGAEIAGYNFGVKNGSITGWEKSAFGGMTFEKVSTDFVGSGVVTSTDFNATYKKNADGEDYWEVVLEVDGLEYKGEINAKTQSPSLLLKGDKGDHIQVKTPGFAAMTNHYKAQSIGGVEPIVGDTMAAFAPGAKDLIINPSTKSNDLGLGSVSAFLLAKGTEGGPITLDELASISVAEDGTVFVTHAEKGTVVAGRISLASFANPGGLTQAGSNYYQVTGNSGEAKYSKPGMNGTGTLKSSALEMSNVDLSSEFSDMITTQRGFQANSRIITVSDTMLEELVNLKR